MAGIAVLCGRRTDHRRPALGRRVAVRRGRRRARHARAIGPTGVRPGTRSLAVGAVVAVVWGWGVAQYPDILPGSLSLAAAAAPAGSQDALFVVFLVAALVIAPSLGLLYTLDQRSRLEGHGLGGEPARARID